MVCPFTKYTNHIIFRIFSELKKRQKIVPYMQKKIYVFARKEKSGKNKMHKKVKKIVFRIDVYFNPEYMMVKLHFEQKAQYSFRKL